MKTKHLLCLIAISLFLPIACTWAAPTIVTDIQMFEVELLTGQFDSFVLDICNEGDEDLVWTIRIEYEGEARAWLSVDPMIGDIVPEADQNAVFTINSTGMAGGQYVANAHVLSNDPNNPDLIVNVLLSVTPSPDIDVLWSEDNGYPDIYDLSRNRQIWVGGPAIYPLTVRNIGTEDLMIDHITTDEAHFTILDEELILQPGESRELGITFGAQNPGVYETVLMVFCNDPDESATFYPIRAEVFGPPQIIVDDDSLEADIENGIGAIPFPIMNSGEYPLQWTASIVPLGDTPSDTSASYIYLTPSTGSIPVDSTQVVMINAEVKLEGHFELSYNLIIQSNDPLHPTFNIPVQISGELPFGVTERDRVPYSSELATLYPNPFNAKSILRIHLDQKSPVDITWQSIDGRSQGIILRGTLNAGYREVVIDSAPLATGVYLIRIDMGHRSSTLRAIVIK